MFLTLRQNTVGKEKKRVINSFGKNQNFLEYHKKEYFSSAIMAANKRKRRSFSLHQKSQIVEMLENNKIYDEIEQ